MCINSFPHFTTCQKEGTSEERVDKLISLVKDEYDIDLTLHKQDMVIADSMDRLEFNFFGPGGENVQKAKFGHIYNCTLHMPGISLFLFSEKGYSK